MHLAFASHVNGLGPIADDVAVAQVDKVNADNTDTRVRPTDPAFLENQIDSVTPMRVQGQEIITRDLVGPSWELASESSANSVETYDQVQLLTQSVKQAIIAGTNCAANVIAVAVNGHVLAVSAHVHLEHMWHVVAEPCIGVVVTLAIKKRACRQVRSAP